MPSTDFPLPRWLLQQGRGYRSVSAGSEESVLDAVCLEQEKEADEPLRRPSRFAELSRSLGQSLLPSAFKSGPPRKLYSTSWLDGLRGVAAFFVVFSHGVRQYYFELHFGYGSTPERTNLLALPLVRIFYSGGAMVAIFFVISGYVLSTKAFKLARLGQHSEVFDNVASSTFRRAPRLYIPTLTIIFITAMAAQLQITDQRAPIHYGPATTLLEQIRIFLSSSAWFITPFGEGHHFEPNSWTIPIEFRGSLLVFLACMGTARCTPRFRLGCLFAMAALWLWHGIWELFLFSAGMLAADLHFVHSPIPIIAIPTTTTVDDITTTATNTEASPTPHQRRHILTRILHALAVLSSMYLLSMPDFDEGVDTSPGFVTLSSTLTPPWWRDHWGAGRWWISISAFLLVLTIDHAGPESLYQRMLTSRFAQYLGDISFCLYLVHGPMLNTVVSRLVRWGCGIVGVNWEVGRLGAAGWWYLVPLLGGWAAGLPLTLWVGEVATNLVDRPSVKLARRMVVW